MKLKNLTTLENLTLPDGFYWLDEFDNDVIEQREDISIDGNVIIFEQEKIGGVKLTLSGARDRVWVSRETLKILKEWGRMPSLLMELSLELPLDNRTFQVSFRHNEKPAIDAKPVLETIPLEGSDFYNVTLKFRIHKEVK